MPYTIIKQLKRISDHCSEWGKDYKSEECPFGDDDTVFLPIRHFNSDSAITPGSYTSIPYNIANRPLDTQYGGGININPCLLGGGYFLWHRGQGVVIDPGYGFVESLYRYHGVSVRFINTVVITHDHLDHHSDLETIINLRRQTLKDPKTKDLKIITNQEVRNAYGLNAIQSVIRSGIEYLEVTPGDSIDLIYKVKANILPCLHWQRVRNNVTPHKLLDNHFHAFGLEINIKDIQRNILITGDTLFPVRENNQWIPLVPGSVPGSQINPYLDPSNGLRLGWSNKDLKGANLTKVENKIKKHCKKMVDLKLSPRTRPKLG